KNPDNRYQSADEMATDLHRFNAGEHVHATPLLPPEPTAVVDRLARDTTMLTPLVSVPVERPRRWIA
ncbi:MAG TPA: hypothetical protein DIT48_02610, partial [Actinobacteria bacterium]|nr:hypothetical protein [Actinomycetota bacterium]